MIKRICEKCIVDTERMGIVAFLTYSYEKCSFCGQKGWVSDIRNFGYKKVYTRGKAKEKKSSFVNDKGEEIVF